MATIVKRKNSYCVVYDIKDDNGVPRQKWETFKTNADAKKRKTQIEYEQENGIFVVPTVTTISELLEEYVSIYGIKHWSMSTYDSKRSLILNYIGPLIGDMKLSDLNPRVMDRFYTSLLKVRAKVVNNRKPKNEYLTPHTVREIHKILRSAFNQAVKWELMAKNPVMEAELPEEEHEERAIWTVEDMAKALEVCDDDILSLAINLAFACSLRLGELLGLQWDRMDISEKAIEEGKAWIFIDKVLQRVNKDAMEALDNKDIMYVFPRLLSCNKTVLVLKAPKTKTSVRKVFLPKTVALMLVERKKQIDELKELLGDEFLDYNLVFAHPSGRPMEGQVITHALKKLIRENDLPDVVFHSLRHASITYKLKWNGGDMKSVQGDSGHARVEMVADVYSHILDEDRRLNAQRFDQQFYQKQALEDKETVIPMPGFKTVEPIQPDAGGNQEDAKSDDKALLLSLLEKPGMADLLKSLAANL